MKKPLVSFCFTTYKRHDYLKKTLQSVKLQTFEDYEVIVSDNDPEGSGREAVESFNDPRFKYFENKENLGMKKSFNKSLERSSGEFIVMIADDDPVYPDMLETLVKLKDQYPGYGLYLGGCNWFCTTPKIGKLYGLKVGMNSFLANEPVETVRTYSASEFLKNFFNFRIFGTYLWSTGMVKREVLVNAGGVPDYNTAFLGDYAYLSIMAAHSGCVVINLPLGHQTIHEQNFGRAQNEQIKTAAVNFIDYVSARINHVQDWPVIKANMERFVGLWVIGHLNFLHRYYKINGGEKVLKEHEKEIMALPVVKPYRFKYWLKKNMPAVHQFLVVVKRNISTKA
jgi:glycosyltransferase involved in cell wall biosynthesis